MAGEIEVEFEGGGKFTVELFEEVAPKNCEMIWNALPIEAEAIHCAYPGHGVWAVTHDNKLEQVHVENQKVWGNLPGTLAIDAYGPETNFNRTEIIIVYGPYYYPRTPFTGDRPINQFGIIKSNLDELLETGKKIREFGKQKVTIRKKL